MASANNDENCISIWKFQPEQETLFTLGALIN